MTPKGKHIAIAAALVATLAGAVSFFNRKPEIPPRERAVIVAELQDAQQQMSKGFLNIKDAEEIARMINDLSKKYKFKVPDEYKTIVVAVEAINGFEKRITVLQRHVDEAQTWMLRAKKEIQENKTLPASPSLALEIWEENVPITLAVRRLLEIEALLGKKFPDERARLQMLLQQLADAVREINKTNAEFRGYATVTTPPKVDEALSIIIGEARNAGLTVK